MVGFKPGFVASAILVSMLERMSRRRLLRLGAAGASTAVLGTTGLWLPRREAGGDLGVSDVNGAAAPPPLSTPGSPTAILRSNLGPAERLGWTAETLRQVARSGPQDRPFVALTIDDGWSARDAVLSVLQQRGVRPTFFLTGRAIANDQQFVARAISAGCEVANHTMDHAWLLDKSKEYIQKDLQDFEALVGSVSPNATTRPYMRPSGGALNQTVIDASAELGYRPILWSASTGDGSARVSADQMVRNALAQARPGAILITHFSNRTVAALPAIIDGFRARGLEAVSLTRLFGSAKRDKST